MDARLPKPFRIEQLCELPCNIAATEIVVRPCVAFLHIDGRKETPPNGSTTTGASQQDQPSEVEESLIPRLDAKEVAAVFSAPFHNFLRERDEDRGRGSAPFPPGHWYDGRWHNFRAHQWRVHNFHVPVDRQRVQKPKPATDEAEAPAAAATATNPDSDPQANLAAKLGEEEERIGRYKVWGMTAHILVDAARLAYDEVPEMEHNPHYGDENIIREMDEENRFTDKKRKVESDPAEDAQSVKKAEPSKM